MSYKRLMTISRDLANSVIEFYSSVNTVVPPESLKGVFTVMGYDNYDADPSSTTSMKTSTHGKSLSLHQLPSDKSQGSKIGPDSILDMAVMDEEDFESPTQPKTSLGSILRQYRGRK